MKYIYIISLALSSIFAYKSVSAKEISQKYAFFVPSNAFQQNTSLDDIENMRPRYSNQDYNSYIEEDEEYDEDIDKEEDYDDDQFPTITLPYVKKNLVFEQATPPNPTVKESQSQKALPSTEKVPQPKIYKAPVQQVAAPKEETVSVPDSEIKEKLKTYNLTSSFDDSPTDNEYTGNKLEAFKRKSIPDMLATIPYPNPQLPKFKQTYATYGMDLRVLYRRGNFPDNYDQEKILEKANSMTRFEVK